MNRKSIYKKLFLIFTLMGMIPLIAVILYGGLRLANHMENHAKDMALLNNSIVNEHLTDVLQNNFYVLHTLANAPTIKRFTASPNPADEAIIRQLLKNSDELFRDNNLTALTNAQGQQIMRSDNAPLVNVTQRHHFQEAMGGRQYVSEVINSMSTGQMIVVLEVPIFDDNHRPIGMLQRNLSVDNLQEFILSQVHDNLDVIVMDQTGRIVAHSNLEATEGEHKDDAYYQKILRVMDSDSGFARIDLQGEDTFVTCHRNQLTNWFIATTQPGRVVYKAANDEVIHLGILGILLLIIVSLIAHVMASRITVPLRQICKVITDIVKGNDDEKKLNILSEDELGEMASAINEIRYMRSTLKHEAEKDSLTGLSSRSAVENICRQRLQNYEESFAPGMMAIFLIDLDNFKKATKEEGHQHGNRILQKFAQGLKDLFRAYDCVGHLDGDEFVVIMDHQKDLTIIKKKAAEINKLARELSVGETNAGISASIGIAVSPQSGKTYNHLFHAADLALFAAKEKGRDCYHIAGEDEGEFAGLESAQNPQ